MGMLLILQQKTIPNTIVIFVMNAVLRPLMLASIATLVYGDVIMQEESLI